ncbi:hypothetical protein ACFQPC_13060 [Herminiimonas glaciei]|uniref:Uncharacterized protein n=1 Tax=Herminiimonas glaciei TaxID=523788 RepID=A0ABW2IDH5_9BURK
MAALETIGGFISNMINPVSNYLAEKIAERWGDGEEPVKAVVLQSLIFTIIWIPVLLLTVAALVFCLFGLGWLFSFF